MKWQWIQNEKARLKREVHLGKRGAGGDLSAVLVYPNTYYVGMSNLGFQAIYGELTGSLGIACERAFFPDEQYLPFFQEKGNLRSLETQKPLHEFDVLAFSISYELDFLNVVRILQMTDIPVLARDRGDDDPLIIAGGSITYLNPEPIAEFIDLFVLGEGEVVLGDILSIVSGTRGEPRLSRLKLLDELPGVYIPSFFAPVYESDGRIREIVCTNRARGGLTRICQKEVAHYFHSVILTEDTEFKSTLLMEIMRGCPFSCAYCAVGNSFGPFRSRSSADIVMKLDELSLPAGRAGLIGAAINCHHQIDEIITELRKRKIIINFSSMRIDGITEKILDIMAEEGHRTLTIAPERGNEALRRALRKNLSDEEIFQSIQLAISKGITSIRLYFMIGFEGEKEEDIDSIINLIEKIVQIARRRRGHSRITACINQFIPKAGTALERSPFAETGLVTERIKRLKYALSSKIKVNAESPRWAYIQALLAMGDRRLSGVLEHAAELTSFSKWKGYLDDCLINDRTYLARNDTIEPWCHIRGITMI
jgi:radical SAM superfamily enzyme YgiQ (UPF0313 family)